MRSAAAYGALAATGCAPSWPAPGVTVGAAVQHRHHRCPERRPTVLAGDQAGPETSSGCGVVPRYAPGVYWIPQGILIDKPLTLDLNGCWLERGSSSATATRTSSRTRTRLPRCGPTTNQIIRSTAGACASTPTTSPSPRAAWARIQGAGASSATEAATGRCRRGCCTPDLEDQAAIVVGLPNGIADVHNTDIDLTNIAVEYALGDGVTSSPRGVGPCASTAAPWDRTVVNANIVNPGSEERLGADGRSRRHDQVGQRRESIAGSRRSRSTRASTTSAGTATRPTGRSAT